MELSTNKTFIIDVLLIFQFYKTNQREVNYQLKKSIKSSSAAQLGSLLIFKGYKRKAYTVEQNKFLSKMYYYESFKSRKMYYMFQAH